MKLSISPRSLLLLGVLLMLWSCAKAPQEVLITGPTMGTTYHIKWVDKGQIAADELQALVDQRLVEVNKLMSTYDPESELSRFNRFDGTEVFPLSDETLLVLNEAKRIGELSQGLFDVTVGPLVNLWGFGPQARPEKVPNADQIAAVQGQIGQDKLLLQSNGAAKTRADLYVDLSPIAKGYGVDAVAAVLEGKQIRNYLVEIGGETRIAGVKANGQPWRIAVEKPVSQERTVQRVISVGNNAIATSGDYRNYYEQDGVRYSHLIDPITGKPITHKLVSVTVVHPSCMTADAWATAISIMGIEKGLALAERENLAVLLIGREQEEFVEYTSKAFVPYFDNQD